MAERTTKLDYGTTASHEISRLIAKIRNSHNVSELLILPSASITIYAGMDLNGRETFLSIELGDSTISTRMYEMAEDIEEPLGQLNANHEIPSTARRNYFAIQTLCLMVKYANLMKAEL
ncbi:hypothetical protein M513_09839 [Trichuris suis]|uniref:Uncharacterized protein n=1 Tax=Trichuris suis TaxID=68888 RepID=A0A085LWE1_9BILA|nr:hypothetical protein M513_09839 [Trichuris suis]